MGEYIPSAPINDEAKKNNKNLPGMGGIFNPINFHLYHYAGNNPIRYVDPDGREDISYEYTNTISKLFNWMVDLFTANSNGGLPYEPELWSDGLRPGDVEKYTNCYAYALNICGINPVTGKQFPRRGEGGFALQPGNLAGYRNLTRIDLLNSDTVINFVKADSKVAGFTFKETTLNGKVKNGNWKVALVIAPGKDYHWYRLNNDGTWSHKPGNSAVTNIDASGNLITDPKFANRDSSKVGGCNYTIFSGYFEVSKCKR